MHLEITLTNSKEVRIPIHYNILVQASIYNSITPELASFLHDKGFQFEKRSFKMFAFSRLTGQYRIDKKSGELVFLDDINLRISSPLDVFCKELGNILLFSGHLRLGSTDLTVKKVEVEKPEVGSDSVIFKTLSPVVTYSTFLKPGGGKYTCYFQPGDKEFAQQIEENLKKKYVSIYQRQPGPGNIEVSKIGQIKQNIIKYKGFVIKGYSCRLKMKGPQELLQLGLDAGIGAKNSQGFGCVKVS